MTQRHISDEMTIDVKENIPGGEEIFKAVLEYVSESTIIQFRRDFPILCPRMSRQWVSLR